jgi:methionyl-tRNA formyltransferase
MREHVVDILAGTKGAEEACIWISGNPHRIIRIFGPGVEPNAITVAHGSYKASLITIEYGKRVPDEVIHRYQATGGAVFNVHRADPRKYAGASVLNHQILDGRTSVDMSLIRIHPDEPLDNGELVCSWTISIRDMIYDEIVSACRVYYESAVYSVFDYIQPTRNRRVFRRSPEDSELELTEEQINTIRAADNERFPAFFRLGNRKIILKAYPEAPPSSPKAP